MTYFAERLAGGKIPVNSPIPAGEDPIFFEPPDEVLKSFRRAKLIASNGAEFEKWMATASLPSSRVVRTADGLPDGFIINDGGAHSHGGETHSHEGTDGHTWLDPHNAIFQATALSKAMAMAFPDEAQSVATMLVALKADLMGLDRQFLAVSPRVKLVTLLASHPAYNYLGRRYGWTLKNFDFDPEEPLKPHELELLKRSVFPGKRTLLLWESQPIEETSTRLADELSIDSVWFSPVESMPDGPGEDYLSIMNANLKRLADALP
jgi:zinc transport system substrate-binding protein